jgi:protein TonB
VSRLFGALTRAKRYPQRARLRRIEGKSQVAFTMRRDGTVISATLIGSSGDADLDEEAVQLVHRASPLPPPPAEMTGDVVSVAMGLDFNLR